MNAFDESIAEGMGTGDYDPPAYPEEDDAPPDDFCEWCDLMDRIADATFGYREPVTGSRDGGSGVRIERYGHSRYWAVYDTHGELVCLCVYKRGALEVVRRLSST